MDSPERDSIRFGDAAIDYVIKRSARRHKTMEISAGPNGVRVAVPEATHPEDIAAFVRNKARWILDRLAGARDAPSQSEVPSSLPYLGRSLSVAIGSGRIREMDVRFRPWELQVFVPQEIEDDDIPQQVRSAVDEWYWIRACEHISTSVDRWWPDLGRESKPEVVIGDQRKRWGSCAANGVLRFNWRLVMLEPRLMDYVVVHELAHLTERNHGPAFWERVRRVLPDVAERRAALRSAEKELQL